MVTPTYYVYFTSTTIITSAVLFQGFKGTPSSIVTVVMGFLTICSGVVLLQLSKSAKDVPDAAVFSGDLNQVRTIAEQEQAETEPKADAIRGTAALVRRFSTTREKMEIEELKRIRAEKEQERLEAVSEDGQPQFEWDGLRRRRTSKPTQLTLQFSYLNTRGMSRELQIAPKPCRLENSMRHLTDSCAALGSQHSRQMTPQTFPMTPNTGASHPPLGMSHFPTDEELAEQDRPFSAGLSSFMGTIRSRATSVLPGHPDFRQSSLGSDSSNALNLSSNKMQSPMHPVQLTEISVAPGGAYGVPAGVKTEYDPGSHGSSDSVGGQERHIHFGGETRHTPDNASLAPPTPPPHAQPHSARRQFSFQNVFKRHRDHGNDGAEERPTSSKSASRPISSRGYSAPHAKTATGKPFDIEPGVQLAAPSPDS